MEEEGIEGKEEEGIEGKEEEEDFRHSGLSFETHLSALFGDGKTDLQSKSVIDVAVFNKRNKQELCLQQRQQC